MTFKMDEKEERKTYAMRDKAISLQNNTDKERKRMVRETGKGEEGMNGLEGRQCTKET